MDVRMEAPHVMAGNRAAFANSRITPNMTFEH